MSLANNPLLKLQQQKVWYDKNAFKNCSSLSRKSQLGIFAVILFWSLFFFFPLPVGMPVVAAEEPFPGEQGWEQWRVGIYISLLVSSGLN